MCLARAVELRITTASVALRRILTAVDAAPSQGADVEGESNLNSYFGFFFLCFDLFVLLIYFPGYIYNISLIIHNGNYSLRFETKWLLFGCSCSYK